MDRVRAFSFRVSGRLNRLTRVYLGPAQVDEAGGRTEVQALSTSTPCPRCGRPMAEHQLERTTTSKTRFYCPER